MKKSPEEENRERSRAAVARAKAQIKLAKAEGRCVVLGVAGVGDNVTFGKATEIVPAGAKKKESNK